MLSGLDRKLPERRDGVLLLTWFSRRYSVNLYEMSGLNTPSVDPSGLRSGVSAVVKVRDREAVARFVAPAPHALAVPPRGLGSALPVANLWTLHSSRTLLNLQFFFTF